MQAARWDIFCKVVDNLGDLGVCWRLARQLADEHGIAPRLWVDDLASFSYLNAEIDPGAALQNTHGVEVRRWDDSIAEASPGEVVIETFGCDVPEPFLAAMVARAPKPAWIDLEYLSAEAWVEGCHGLPSPHPRVPLTRYFFFPGFTPGTGGLLRERGLLARRRDFLADPLAQRALWRELSGKANGRDALKVLLFCYPNPALPELLATWAAGREDVACFVPAGAAAEQAAGWFAPGETLPPACYQRGRLRVWVVPFVDQQHFDQRLWFADVNFVRGEDSFVRAQWAGRPFVWHIYPQRENAHWVKLNAFIDCFVEGLADEPAGALRAFWRAWVSGRGAGAAWPAFREAMGPLQSHAGEWLRRQAARDDLASNLARFTRGLLK